MATRQYIGARYTPKFSGTYDATQAYEALEVVDNGSGTTYIARKPVPPNTPLTNTDYWLVYGSSSGAILDLQGRVTEIEETDLPAINQDISNINGSILTMGGQISSNTSDINDLKDEADKSILIIGNSFTQRGCADKVAALFDHNYKYLRGGTGFLGHTGNLTTYEDLLDEAINDPNLDKSEIDEIIFVCAYDETVAYTESTYASTRTALNGKLAAINTKIKANFTSCKRAMVTLAESRNQAYFVNATYESIFGIHKLFTELCPDNGLEYIGWTGWNLMFKGSGYFDTDSFHPSPSGAAIIAQDMLNAYFGNLRYITKSETKQIPFYLTGNDGKMRISSYVRPDHVTICGAYTTITSGAPTITINNLLVALRELVCPPVAPFAGDLYITSDILDTVGASRLSGISAVIKNSPTSGIGEIYCANTPGSTSIGSSSPKLPGFNTISYSI